MASASAPAPATVTPAATATTATVTPAASTTTAFALRTGFVDDEGAAEKFLAVERGNCLFGFSVIFDFRETESARLAGEAIAKQSERIGLHARFGKKSMHVLFCSLER
jgi:hypothetical protein